MLPASPTHISPGPRRHPMATVEDPVEAERLIDDHAGSLFAAACLILTDRDAAVSSTVEAFRAAWSAPVRGACNPGRRELVRYLYLECQHRLAAGSTTNAQEPSPEGSGWAMMAALGLLSQHQRSVLALGLYGELTYQQIADLVDLPAPTVADLIRSGLHELS